MHGRSRCTRKSTWRAFFEQIKTGMCGDGIEPGAYLRVTSKGIEASPGAQHGLLYQVFSIFERPQETITMETQFLPIWFSERTKKGGIPHTFRCHAAPLRCLFAVRGRA